LKVPSRAFKSEVIYSGKILIVEETHDKKKEELKPKISGKKKMSLTRIRKPLTRIKKKINAKSVKAKSKKYYRKHDITKPL